MRLLLLDNHDSFTAILHHYLWELAGERPMLYRNDELTRDALEALDFDAAVLSPGPGHPANVRDFGVCRDLLELFPHKPVLGVCLGMQGLAHFAGARVVPWADALHGRPSHIVHNGTGLFRGIPPEFTAIRYHSLVVDPESLPANVSVTARAKEDGQIMSIAFADRPWFGAQFHPESLGTQYGMEFLANFLDRAKPDRRRPQKLSADPAQATDGRKDVPNAARNGSDVDPIPYVELAWRDPAETFVRFFKTASPTSAVFWLDGAQARPDSGWPSTVMGRGEKIVTVEKDASAASMRRLFGVPRAVRNCPWPGYRGGPVGQFDYEWNAIDATETRNAPASVNASSTVGRWMVPEGWLAFDHETQHAYAAWEGSAPPQWLRAVIDAWNTAPTSDGTRVGSSQKSEITLPPYEDWSPSMTEAQYTENVLRLQEAIARGETYEACLTHAFSVASDADALEVFLRLRARNPAPYAAFLAFPDVRILSASPELFLEMTDGGVLRSRPIKGTRRRGGDATSDRALRADLQSSEKDAAENRMITDLTRNDLARVCAVGSIEVPAFLEIEEHPAVFQLVSEVRGRLAGGFDRWDALAACFPGGSMTGAPKERTMEILRSVENGPRRVYSGALGYLTDGGAFTFSMVIRTLVEAGGLWRVGCGGAVLIDSDPTAEWREATVKARSVLDAVSEG
jgi:para-aminobenzoate synthetase